MDNVITKVKNLKDFFKSPLFIVTGIVSGVLFLFKLFSYYNITMSTIKDFAHEEISFRVLNLFSSFFDCMDAVLYLILAVAFILLYVFSKKNISLNASFVLFRIFSIVSICTGIGCIIFICVGQMLSGADSDIIYSSYGTVPVFIQYILVAIGILLFLKAIRKGIADNVILKMPVIIFIVIYVIRFLSVADTLWLYIQLLFQEGSVAINLQSLSLLFIEILAVIFVIMGYKYLTFLKVNDEDDYDNYETIEESAE